MKATGNTPGNSLTANLKWYLPSWVSFQIFRYRYACLCLGSVNVNIFMLVNNMKIKDLTMRSILFVFVLTLTTACNTLDGPGRRPGSPGYIEKGESLYDGKRFVKLVPGSLFDADNTPGVFRLGLVWDERYGDHLHLIVTFPLGKVTSTSELRKSTGTLSLKIDGEKSALPRLKNSIKIVEDGSISKEHGVNIKYKISRQTIKRCYLRKA